MKRPFRLILLLLPLIGLAGAWLWTHARAQQGIEWDVPVSASGPSASLRGRFVTYRYEWGLPGESDSSTSAALCLEGSPPVLASVRASVRASDPEDQACRSRALAVEGGSRHEGIDGGIVYVPQDQVPTIRARIRDPNVQALVRIRVNDAGAITPLGISFRPR
jgi:hypothetical protein